MILSETQKSCLSARVMTLCGEVVSLARTDKEVMRIIEALFRLKFKLDHDQQIAQVKAQGSDWKDKLKEAIDETMKNL